MNYCTRRSSLLVKFVWISIYSKLQLGFIVWNWDRQPNGGESGSVEKKLYLFLEFAFDLYIMRTHTHTSTLTRIRTYIWIRYFGQLCNCVVSIWTFYWHKPTRTHIDELARNANSNLNTDARTQAVMICLLYHRRLLFFLLLTFALSQISKLFSI